MNPRNTLPQLFVSLLSVLCGILAGALLMMIIGENPIVGYASMLRGSLMNLERLGNMLATATPLIFTGLSVAFAFRAGLFNVGAAGQMLIGGFFASAVGLSFNLPSPWLLLAMIMTAMLSGALWAFLPGLFKARYNVHEVVSTIMFNWIAYWVVYYTVPTYFRGAVETESRHVSAAASLRLEGLTQVFDGSYINLGLPLALVAVLLIAILIDRTVLGYEMKAVGFNRDAAEGAGIDAERSIVSAMLIAGALAGLGGMSLYCGYAVSIEIGVLPSQGNGRDRRGAARRQFFMGLTCSGVIYRIDVFRKRSHECNNRHSSRNGGYDCGDHYLLCGNQRDYQTRLEILQRKN